MLKDESNFETVVYDCVELNKMLNYMLVG